MREHRVHVGLERLGNRFKQGFDLGVVGRIVGGGGGTRAVVA
jgi:hypothetical protein